MQAAGSLGHPRATHIEDTLPLFHPNSSIEKVIKTAVLWQPIQPSLLLILFPLLIFIILFYTLAHRLNHLSSLHVSLCHKNFPCPSVYWWIYMWPCLDSNHWTQEVTTCFICVQKTMHVQFFISTCNTHVLFKYTDCWCDVDARWVHAIWFNGIFLKHLIKMWAWRRASTLQVSHCSTIVCEYSYLYFQR